jgi:hypothetical protein
VSDDEPHLPVGVDGEVRQIHRARLAWAHANPAGEERAAALVGDLCELASRAGQLRAVWVWLSVGGPFARGPVLAPVAAPNLRR